MWGELHLLPSCRPFQRVWGTTAAGCWPPVWCSLRFPCPCWPELHGPWQSPPSAWRTARGPGRTALMVVSCYNTVWKNPEVSTSSACCLHAVLLSKNKLLEQINPSSVKVALALPHQLAAGLWTPPSWTRCRARCPRPCSQPPHGPACNKERQLEATAQLKWKTAWWWRPMLVLTFLLLSSSAYFSAFFTMFSISSLLRPPDDWITTARQQDIQNSSSIQKQRCTHSTYRVQYEYLVLAKT